MVREFYFDRLLFISFLLLLSVGIVFIFSASSSGSVSSLIFKKHLIVALAGLLVMFISYLIPIKFWKKFAYLSVILAFILLVLVLFLPGLKTKSGSEIHRWINLGLFKFQPSEFAKFAVVLFVARFIELKKDAYLKQFKSILTVGFVVGLIVILIMIEPHNSGALFIAIIVLLMMLSSNFSLRHILILGFIFLPIGLIGILSNEYAVSRFLSVIDPLKYRSHETYQPFEAILAFAKGGLFGEGIGEGMQKFFYLPEIHTDYIYALIGEETGFLGAVFVLSLFVVILLKGLSISLRKEDRFTQALGVGVTYLITVQAFLHILVNLSLFPSTGFTLPFISYGGTSLLMNMVYAGILLRISKERDKNILGGVRNRKR